MSEDIELNPYCTTQKVQSDSDDYYEIDQSMLDSAVSYKNKVSPCTEVTFFTHRDANLKKKTKRRKKRIKKDNETNNMMDLINSKIRSDEVPIVKNVIKVKREEQSTFLENNLSLGKLLQCNMTSISTLEHGLSLSNRNVQINPSFPNIEKDLDNIFTQYVKPIMYNDLVVESTRGDSKDMAKFLDISIKHIYFKHHHEFSLEKILTIQLKEYYAKYTQINKTIVEILRSIDVNRKTMDSLKEKFLTISPNKKNDIRFDPTIRRYTSAMLDFKKKYLSRLKEKRELESIIISFWSDIKNVRDKVGTIETSLEVEINEISLTAADDFSKKWNNIFETEYSDMLVKLEFDYVTKYLEYKELKKNSDKIKQNILKPKLNINPEEIKHEITKIVEFLLNRNEIEIKLGNNKKVSKAIAKNKYDSYTKTLYFKIYVDDVFVCESERINIKDHNLKTDYNDSLTLQILGDNKILSILLCENDTDLSKFTINLKEIRKSYLNTEFNEKYFICDKIVKPNMESVGSGMSVKDIATYYKIKLKSSNVFKEKLFTTCKVALKIGWNDKLSEKQNETIKNFMSIEHQIRRIIHNTDDRNVNELLDIINNIYDNEIEDESIKDSLREMCKSAVKEDDFFLIDENPDYVRFKLLNLRNNGGFSSVTNKTVPLFPTQVTTEQLSSLQKSEEKDFDVEYFESKRGGMDPIDLQRYMGMKFVEKINKKILTDLNERLLRKTHKDVVMDFKDLSLRTIFANKPNLTLDRSSSIARKQLKEEGLAKEQEIQITVLRALNLMDRTEEESDGDFDDIAGYRMRSLRPFIRVSYHGETVQSPIAVGSHPTWNYTAKIKSKIQPVSCIHINIYDEHKVNLNQESDMSSQSFRYRSYNKWLGTVAIPMNTVINMGTLHGTFKVTTPPFFFGYRTQSNESNSIIPEITRLMRKDTAFITLRVTTSLSHLGGCEFYNQPSETDDPIIQHLNSFITDYLIDFPTRNINLTFIDSSGKNKCVTEFIQPLPLPEILSKEAKRIESASKSSKSSSSSRKKNSDKIDGREESVFEIDKPDVSIFKLMDIAVRYVSLIPTFELVESHFVTLRGIELLKVQYGSTLDHTLLLASYFVHLGVKCWVAIGQSLPRGLSSYIMVKYHGNRIVMADDTESRGFFNREEVYRVVIFDAVNGEKHDVRDVGCPLKTVSYVFDGENIWVNIQTSQDCSNLLFDFTKSSNWQLVFNKSVFVINEPAITTNVYSPPGDVENLRGNLENKIKAKIQKWRWNVRTIWNRYLSNLLRESLPDWEYWSLNQDDDKPLLGHRLKQLMATYKIFGFPLNMHYLNTKTVVSRVKSTMFHVNDDPKVEFGLAVEVYAYPNNVLSVWVFLASMTRM